MISKQQIEKILKINGVSPSSPDENIRSILLSARYKEDEVDTALMVLKENTKTNKTRVDGLHKVFRTDESLNAKEISQLLGIDIELESMSELVVSSNSVDKYQMILIWILSIILAILGTVTLMYLNEMGIFHDSYIHQ